MAQFSSSLRGWALKVRRASAPWTRSQGRYGRLDYVHCLVVDEGIPDEVFHVSVSVDRVKRRPAARRAEIVSGFRKNRARPLSSLQSETPAPSRQFLCTAGAVTPRQAFPSGCPKCAPRTQKIVGGRKLSRCLSGSRRAASFKRNQDPRYGCNKDALAPLFVASR
ncbi:hypothetical protein N657DRAFT_218237 [Parathielavia appendiculata]|uniref:Transposase n=1 Tax=Parathielavia appendiculata TaxID=2587402 RepID=A0AAN6U7A6_9PEZI|nr:hypothetical protein N657DRAFT_218237 [Parathielavia appendiculata]